MYLTKPEPAAGAIVLGQGAEMARRVVFGPQNTDVFRGSTTASARSVSKVRSLRGCRFAA